jgi:hypothetical protein
MRKTIPPHSQLGQLIHRNFANKAGLLLAIRKCQVSQEN